MTTTQAYAGLLDEKLAKAVQDGDLQAYEQVVERYSAKLLRYASRFLKRPEDVEDIVQNVFIKAYQNINQFDTDRKFSSWLYRITHNECVNELRRSGKSEVTFFDPDEIFPHPVSPEQPETDAQRREIKALVDDSLQELDLKYREVVLLYYYEELSYDEIADVLHVPVNTVGVRLSRAKSALKKVIMSKPNHE